MQIINSAVQCVLSSLTQATLSRKEKASLPALNLCCCLVAKSCLTFCNPIDCSPQALLSMGFPRQEYWRGLSFVSPGDLPEPGIEPMSPALQVDSLLLKHQVSPLKVN